MESDWIRALAGGTLIGLASSIMLIFQGRIAGISGIFLGVIRPQNGDRNWRLLFLIGLILGGLFFNFIDPSVFGPAKDSVPLVLVSGFLVGFGTVLGGGCTSGHGVCGISRLSRRSIMATLIFMGSAMITVYLTQLLAG